MRVLAATGDFNALAVGVFACVLAVTLLITRWAAKRTHSATEFYAAGRGVSGAANGVATAGDYLSASTFLGYAGLMYLYGFDGWVIGLGACLSFLPVLYLLAERMRNAGKFTVADVLSFRLKARPVRVATAINTLLISGIYLVAQLVGAGAVIEALAKFNFNPSHLLDSAARNHPDGNAILGPGTYLTSPILVISTGLTIFIGTAGLPHILTRFFTVPDSPGRAQVRALHDRHHRHVHRVGHDHRLRRPGAARPGRDRGRRQGRQPRRAAARAVPRRR
jgi:cation/acetate symporter